MLWCDDAEHFSYSKIQHKYRSHAVNRLSMYHSYVLTNRACLALFFIICKIINRPFSSLLLMYSWDSRPNVARIDVVAENLFALIEARYFVFLSVIADSTILGSWHWFAWTFLRFSRGVTVVTFNRHTYIPYIPMRKSRILLFPVKMLMLASESSGVVSNSQFIASTRHVYMFL